MLGSWSLGSGTLASEGYYIEIVGNSATVQYDVFVSAGKSTNHKYDVFYALSDDIAYKYDVFNYIGRDITFEYDITSLYVVTRALNMKYDINQLATKNIAKMYDILTTTQKMATYKYDVFVLVGNSNTIKYDISMLMLRDIFTKYDILTLINRDSNFKYDIYLLANKDISLNYDVSQRALKALTYKYDVFGINYSSFPYGLISNTNFVVCFDFIDYTISASSSQNNAPVTNLKDYYHPRRTWKATGKTSEYLEIDLGNTSQVKYIMLNNANFRYIRIEGNNTNNWYDPPFVTQRTIAKDERVNRRKSVFELQGFEYRYMRIYIYSTDVEGDYIELGNLIIPKSNIEFKYNPDFGYRYGTKESMKQTEFETGGIERTTLSSVRRFYGEFGFSYYPKEHEADHFILANLSHSLPVVFVENLPDAVQRGDKSYLCFVSKDVEITWTNPTYVKTHDYLIEEIV